MHSSRIAQLLLHLISIPSHLAEAQQVEYMQTPNSIRCIDNLFWILEQNIQGRRSSSSFPILEDTVVQTSKDATVHLQNTAFHLQFPILDAAVHHFIIFNFRTAANVGRQSLIDEVNIINPHHTHVQGTHRYHRWQLHQHHPYVQMDNLSNDYNASDSTTLVDPC